VILATQEAEVRRIAVGSQPGEIVLETLSWKNHHKERAGGVAQSVGPEFKPQYHKKTPKNDLPQPPQCWDLQACTIMLDSYYYYYYFFCSAGDRSQGLVDTRKCSPLELHFQSGLKSLHGQASTSVLFFSLATYLLSQLCCLSYNFTRITSSFSIT
jgi:hypothetical protein